MQSAENVYTFPHPPTENCRPAPLLPPDVDLAGFHFLPLSPDRLEASPDWRRARREPFHGYRFLALLMASFREYPAGSLPNDDHALADVLRIDDDEWPSIKASVMREWTLCSDDRWHHPVAAAMIGEAWSSRSRNRARTAAATAAREAQRHDERDGQRHDERDDVQGREGREGKGTKGVEQKDSKICSLAAPDGEPQGKVRSPSNKGTRIPADWQPDRTAAAAEGLAAHEIDREAASFRDYWTAKPGSGGVKLDWDATWRNWVRNYVSRRGSRSPTAPPPKKRFDL